MAGSAAQTVNYYYKQDTNQILVGSGDGSVTTVGDMNALITSSKDPALSDIYTVARIKSLGQAVTYQSQAVYNSASDGTGFTIDIQDDQELWVYRGIQPPNTVPNGTPSDAGPGDSNHTQYNAYLHRPYKLYMLTETGSGVGTDPWLPVGAFYNESTGGGTNTPGFPNVFNVKQQGIVGNLDYTSNNFLVSQSVSSGSFTVLQDHREIHPWVYTKYNSLSQPPAVGSFWKIYAERSDTANFGSQIDFDGQWNTATGGGDPGSGKAAANNSTAASVTEVYVATDSWSTATGTGQSPIGLVSSISQSGIDGKPMGNVRLVQESNTANFANYNITAISGSFVGSDFITFTVNTPDIGGTWPPTNNTDISMSFDGPVWMGTVQQIQQSFLNAIPNFSNIKLKNALYSFTSSQFDVSGGNGTAASGSCQFGLWAEYDDYVEYKATVDALNSSTVRVTYTGSDGLPKFSDINPGFNGNFTAVVGTVSSSGDDSSSTFTLEIVANTAVGSAPTDVFSTRISDVYLSLSSSLSQSIDGLYIFNQLPSEDIYVTASMLLNAWTGSDPGAAKYGETNVTYSISPDPPVYGEGEAGDGTSWPTASINIYKGNYPLNVPIESDTPLHTEQFVTLDGDYGNNGVAITTSFVLPSSSISFQDCLNMSLSVTSGSSPASMVENSLVVSEYQLEFNNAAAQEGADGRVPTFIDNAFKGTGGFSNAPDCQPTLNNVVQERNNDQIQLIEYSNDPYDPSNFQLILSNSAAKSTVPESNYLTLGWISGRYDGSIMEANDVNTIEGLVGGYGETPVIEYKRAYLAYCDQVTDPYPVVNRKTQFNIQYLINGGGDALNPLISEYTAFDVLGTWDEGGLGQVGINQISGSTQFDQLNGYQTTFKVGKQAIPLLYSQVSADATASVIPIAGNQEQISRITSSFIEYDMSSQGSNKVAGAAGPNLQNTKQATYFNIAQGIATQTAVLMPQSPGAFNSGQFTINSSSGYGINRQPGGDTPNVIEQPIITASIAQPYAKSDANVFGSDYFGNPGEVFFTADPLGTGSGLSDDYEIRGTFVLPSTYPSYFRHKKGSKKKKSKYTRGNVGTLKFSFESTDSPVTSSDTSNGAYIWTPERMEWLSDNSSQGYQEPTMTFYYGTVPGSTNGLQYEASFWDLTSDHSWDSAHSEYTFEIQANTILNHLNSNGQTPGNVQYVTYNIPFQSDTDLVSGRRYRFKCMATYKTEIDNSSNDARNYYNPTTLPTDGDGAEGGTFTNPIQYTSTFPSNGPYVSMNVIGAANASSLQSNALNAPFWTFVQTQGTPAFNFGLNADSTPFNQTNTVTDPGSGNIFFNNASGSIEGQASALWMAQSSIPTVTNSNFALISSGFTTNNKGDFGQSRWVIRSNSGGIYQVYLQSYSTTTSGWVAGDTITFPRLLLEQEGFGTVSGDLVITLNSNNILFNQLGSNQLTISKTDLVGSSINTILTNIDAINSSAGVKDFGKLELKGGTYSNEWTGSITGISLSTDYATLSFENDATNSGNTGLNSYPYGNFAGGVNAQIEANFTTGSTSIVPQNTVIELSSSNGNDSYGLGYFQGYLPYTASANANFPGGMEPQDTAWPLPNVAYTFRINDEIRFMNDEKLSFKIIKILTPQENFIETGRDKLQLTVDKPIPSSTILDFFLIRRYISSPNSIIVDKQFPYGPLPVVKEFVPSSNTLFQDQAAFGGSSYPASSSIEQSGSFVEFVKPLLKKDNTPSGILKPEYPVVELEVSPDEVIRDLRDKKLIE